jgi:hypothetical protein
MKKTMHFFFMLSFLLVLKTPAISQIGIKAGPTATDIVFAVEGQSPYLGYEVDYLTHRNPLFSYQLGLFGTVKLNRLFYFQPELMYARQGLNYNIEFLYDAITYRLFIDYLQLPLLINLRMRPEKKFHPGFFLGPYAAIKINAKRITEIDGNLTEQKATNVKNGDFGLIGGLSFDFDMNKGQLVTDLRFNYSLKNIMYPVDGYIPAYDGPDLDEERARNVAIALLIGYRFQIPK